jgi:hypothetical protein
MQGSGISLSTLLERILSECELADGRTVRLCRDANGGYWVVDGAERIMSLREFDAPGNVAAREFRDLARAESLGRLMSRAKEALAHVAQGVQRIGAKSGTRLTRETGSA